MKLEIYGCVVAVNRDGKVLFYSSRPDCMGKKLISDIRLATVFTSSRTARMVADMLNSKAHVVPLYWDPSHLL